MRKDGQIFAYHRFQLDNVFIRSPALDGFASKHAVVYGMKDARVQGNTFVYLNALLTVVSIERPASIEVHFDLNQICLS
jgi:hypothetical protein